MVACIFIVADTIPNWGTSTVAMINGTAAPIFTEFSEYNKKTWCRFRDPKIIINIIRLINS